MVENNVETNDNLKAKIRLKDILCVYEKYSPSPLTVKKIAEELNTEPKNVHAHFSNSKKKKITFLIVGEIGRENLYGISTSSYHELMHENYMLNKQMEKTLEENRKYKNFLNLICRFFSKLIQENLISDSNRERIVSLLLE